MTKINHTLSGILLAEVVMASMYPGLLTTRGISYALENGKNLEALAPVVAGCIAGSIFPDIDLRIPGLPHRSLTHWFAPYAALLLFAYFTGRPLLFFFCAGSLLHILLDSLSMTGVPVLSPFGKREGLRMMTVGGAADPMITVIMFMCILGGLW